jgi:hypothetical protein
MKLWFEGWNVNLRFTAPRLQQPANVPVKPTGLRQTGGGARVPRNGF